MSEPVPYRGPFTGPQFDEALLKVRSDLLYVDNVRSTSISTILTYNDHILICNANLTVHLPDALETGAGHIPHEFVILNRRRHTITVISSSGDFIDSDDQLVVTGSIASVTLRCDGTGWIVTSLVSATSGALLSANNLSDIGNTSTARTNLGLAIGSNVQAYSANLASWSAIATSTKLSLTGGTMSGILKISDGTYTAPSLAMSSDSTSGLYWDHSLDDILGADGALSITVAGNPILQMTAFGTVFNSPLGGGGLFLTVMDTAGDLNGTVLNFCAFGDPFNSYGGLSIDGTTTASILTVTAGIISLNPTTSVDVLNTLNFLTAGKSFSVKTGSNQRAGNLTLVGGTKTVNNTTVTANTIVILTRKTSGGTIGTSITYTLSAGVSFTVTSDNILDTSVFTYLLIELN